LGENTEAAAKTLGTKCTEFAHVCITDLGMEKRKASASDPSVEAVVGVARPLLD